MWGTSARRGPLVLLVEDDEDPREMTKMLEMRGFDVESARDAVGAITTCRMYQGTIDLRLTDLGLPGVSGGELAVVYISGIPQDIAVKKGLIKRDAPFIAKPFTADVLAGTLRTVLSQHPTTSAR